MLLKHDAGPAQARARKEAARLAAQEAANNLTLLTLPRAYRIVVVISIHLTHCKVQNLLFGRQVLLLFTIAFPALSSLLSIGYFVRRNRRSSS
jgi:hypothetical protein